MRELLELKVTPFLFMLFFAVVIIVSFLLMESFFYNNIVENIALENAKNKTIERNQFISAKLKKDVDTIESIRKNSIFKEYLLGKGGSEEGVKDLFKAISYSDEEIMQVRFIDRRGKERVRLDRRRIGGEIYEIPKERLQDKSARYYFYDNINRPEKVLFSNLDLNIEHKRVEIPFKPTYRAILPVRLQNEIKGMIIINYFAKKFLGNLFNAPLYDGFLVDEDGYVMYHFKKEKEWSRFKERPFKIDEAYREILGKEYYEGLYFSSRAMDLPFANNFYMVLQLSEKFLNHHSELKNSRVITMTMVVFVISIIISLIFFYIIEGYKSIKRSKDSALKQEREAKEYQERLMFQQNRMAEVGSMISAVAHQWKQPLNAIYLDAQMLYMISEEETIQAELLKAEKKIVERVDFMNKTINDFRNFFSPSKEKQEFLACEPIEIVANMFKKEFEGSNVEVVIHEHEHFRTYGQQNEFMQAALIILNNAKDEYIKKGIGGTIDCRFESDGERGIITISDHAGGIPEELLPDKIFTAFFTTKGDKGTGVGLQIAKMVIEDSFKGKLSARNTKDGAEFTIDLDITQMREGDGN